jgi:cation diffusion facilitator CzcD-associated flavoprotein CzcO
MTAPTPPPITRTTLSWLDPRAGLDVTPLPDAAARLDALAARVHDDLAVLDYPIMPWVTPRQAPDGSTHVWDVLIAGAGQGGLATAFALRREKVDNVLLVDRAAPGQEGPWVTYARMLTFRSPKHVTGPDLGIASLTPRAYYTARFGEAAWERLGKYPRQTWQDYLDWYRATLDLPVRNHTDVRRIEPVGELFRVHVRATGPDGLEGVVWARKVVLATGIEGNGDWRLPDLDLASIPRDRYSHTNWVFDVAALRGQRIAVLGAGASAFDTAAALLEAGAAEVTQFVRRADIPNVNPARWMERAGFLRHFADMDDLTRWRWMRILFLRAGPPTQDGINRCAAFANYRLRKGTTWRRASYDGAAITLEASDGSIGRYDFLVVGTGYVIDVRRRPELADFADQIALWQDRFTPPAGEANAVVAGFPYLGPDLSFQERTPGTAPFLANIHNFTYSATASVGYSGASLTGMKYGLQRMLSGITRSLWLQDQAAALAAMQAYDEVDLDVTPLDPHAGQVAVHAMAPSPAPSPAPAAVVPVAE